MKSIRLFHPQMGSSGIYLHNLNGKMKSIDLVTYYFVFLLERRRFKKLFDSVEIGLIKFCLLDLFHTVLESDLLVFSGANTQSFYNKVMIKVEASQFPGHHLLIITPISSF